MPRGTRGVGTPKLDQPGSSPPGKMLFQLRLEGVGVKQKAEASVPVSSAGERVHEKDGV